MPTDVVADRVCIGLGFYFLFPESSGCPAHQALPGVRSFVRKQLLAPGSATQSANAPITLATRFFWTKCALPLPGFAFDRSVLKESGQDVKRNLTRRGN